MHTYVIILNWCNADDTLECVDSVLRSETDLHIVVCDNASPDGSCPQIISRLEERMATAKQVQGDEVLIAEAEGDSVARDARDAGAKVPASLSGNIQAYFDLPALGKKITVIQTGKNLGYAGGNNVGLRYALSDAECRYCWVLNNDTFVEPTAIGHITDRLNSDASIGLCGCTVLYASQPEIVQTYGGGWFSNKLGRPVNAGFQVQRSDAPFAADIEPRLTFIYGAAVMCSRRFLEEVGLMDESYFLYCEELDWGERASSRFKLGVALDAVVYHKVGRSIGTNDFGRRSEMSEYYLRRNRLRFCWSHRKAALPRVVGTLLKDIAFAAMRRDYERLQTLYAAARDAPSSRVEYRAG